jgi:hypothetical protein
LKNYEFCCAGFEGGKAISKIGCAAVKGSAEEVTHRGEGGAKCPADLALEGVELGIAEETELESEVFPNEVSADDAYSVGLCEHGSG